MKTPAEYALQLPSGAICNCVPPNTMSCKRHIAIAKVIQEAMNDARAAAFESAQQAVKQYAESHCGCATTMAIANKKGQHLWGCLTQSAEGFVEVIAALASKPAGAEQGNWQPIDTAPKDGTCVLLLSAAYENEIQGEIFTHHPKAAIGYWNPEGSSWVPDGPPDEEESSCTLAVTGVWNSGGGWFQPNEVTHWQPLPSPPTRDAVAEALGNANDESKCE